MTKDVKSEPLDILSNVNVHVEFRRANQYQNADMVEIVNQYKREVAAFMIEKVKWKMLFPQPHKRSGISIIYINEGLIKKESVFTMKE